MVSLVMIITEKPPHQSAISFVGSNSTVNREQKGGIGGRVFVTPIPTSQQQMLIPTSSRLQSRMPPSFIILKLLLKAVSKSTKKSEVFTLRDINVDSCDFLSDIEDHY